jgi:hypothetical protein
MSDSLLLPRWFPEWLPDRPLDNAVRSQSKCQSCLPRRPENTTTRPSTKLLRISHELSGADVLVSRPLLARSALLGTESCSVVRLPHIQPSTMHSHDILSRQHTFPHMDCVSLEVVFNSTSFGTPNCRSVCRVGLPRRTLSRGSGQTDQGRPCHAYCLFRYRRATAWNCKTKACRPTKVGHRWRRGGTRQTRYTLRYRGY